MTIRDKNNIVRIVVERRGHRRPLRSRASSQVFSGARVQTGPRELTIGGARRSRSSTRPRAPRTPVTGKRVTLSVDRYYLTHAGKDAIVDLGTPVGVDNVDAYRLMIESFRWR